MNIFSSITYGFFSLLFATTHSLPISNNTSINIQKLSLINNTVANNLSTFNVHTQESNNKNIEPKYINLTIIELNNKNNSEYPIFIDYDPEEPYEQYERNIDEF